jgi:putative colanic acid biosynthesis acetyltransferase WcaF
MSTEPFDTNLHSSTAESPEEFYKGEYLNRLSLKNRVGRIIWGIVYLVLFRLTPVPCFGWRRMLLRCFGATLAASARVYPSVRIWAPWNLTMESRACLAQEVYCYNVDRVFLGADSTVSFRSFLCTASHDINHPQRPLVTAPIRIERGAYLFADAFIGMKVTVGEGAVVAARAVVVRSVAPFDVVGGNPARVISHRKAPE